MILLYIQVDFLSKQCMNPMYNKNIYVKREKSKSLRVIFLSHYNDMSHYYYTNSPKKSIPYDDEWHGSLTTDPMEQDRL